MNHANNATLEGIIQDIRIGVNDKNKETVSIFLKSTRNKSMGGKEFSQNFSIWLQVWGNLQAKAKTLKKNDLIKISGEFETKMKEKDGMKSYSVIINLKTLEPLVQQVEYDNSSSDDLPF